MISCLYYDPQKEQWLNGFCDDEDYFTVYPVLESGEPDENNPILSNLIVPLSGTLYY